MLLQLTDINEGRLNVAQARRGRNECFCLLQNLLVTGQSCVEQSVGTMPRAQFYTSEPDERHSSVKLHLAVDENLTGSVHLAAPAELYFLNCVKT